jgi:putative spermidine/putrescine transport system substrate-binding protein
VYKKLSRRQFLNLAAAASAAGLVLPRLGFAQDATAVPELPPAPAPGPLTAEAAGGMDALIEAANAEGELSTIALPDDWANYGEIKRVFFEKYPGIATITTSTRPAAARRKSKPSVPTPGTRVRRTPT